MFVVYPQDLSENNTRYPSILPCYPISAMPSCTHKILQDCTTNQVNGRNVINFTVAHSERYKDAQGGQKEKTIWVDCAYWTERPGIAPYLRKGQQVYVEGVPDLRTYTRNDGSAGAALVLSVRSIQLLGSAPREDAEEGSNVGGTSLAVAGESGGADELPF
jgi:single-strand DNA-binding protein